MVLVPAVLSLYWALCQKLTLISAVILETAKADVDEHVFGLPQPFIDM
jgi:hypothetical protein